MYDKSNGRKYIRIEVYGPLLSLLILQVRVIGRDVFLCICSGNKEWVQSVSKVIDIYSYFRGQILIEYWCQKLVWIFGVNRILNLQLKPLSGSCVTLRHPIYYLKLGYLIQLPWFIWQTRACIYFFTLKIARNVIFLSLNFDWSA